MDYTFQIAIAIFITLYFIFKEKPRIRYLFYGYIFFLITLVLQIPFKLIEIYLHQFVPTESTIPVLISGSAILVITTISKYFTLKEVVSETNQSKDGVLFGIGWATFESIQYFSLVFFSYFFTYFAINFDYTLLLTQQNQMVNFVYFFIFNLSITVLVIFTIIKDTKFYLIIALAYSLIIFYLLSTQTGTNLLLIEVVSFIISLLIIFKHKSVA